MLKITKREEGMQQFSLENSPWSEASFFENLQLSNRKISLLKIHNMFDRFHSHLNNFGLVFEATPNFVCWLLDFVSSKNLLILMACDANTELAEIFIIIFLSIVIEYTFIVKSLTLPRHLHRNVCQLLFWYDYLCLPDIPRRSSGEWPKSERHSQWCPP